MVVVLPIPFLHLKMSKPLFGSDVVSSPKKNSFQAWGIVGTEPESVVTDAPMPRQSNGYLSVEADELENVDNDLFLNTPEVPKNNDTDSSLSLTQVSSSLSLSQKYSKLENKEVTTPIKTSSRKSMIIPDSQKEHFETLNGDLRKRVSTGNLEPNLKVKVDGQTTLAVNEFLNHDAAVFAPQDQHQDVQEQFFIHRERCNSLALTQPQALLNKIVPPGASYYELAPLVSEGNISPEKTKVVKVDKERYHRHYGSGGLILDHYIATDFKDGNTAFAKGTHVSSYPISFQGFPPISMKRYREIEELKIKFKGNYPTLLKNYEFVAMENMTGLLGEVVDNANKTNIALIHWSDVIQHLDALFEVMKISNAQIDSELESLKKFYPLTPAEGDIPLTPGEEPKRNALHNFLNDADIPFDWYFWTPLGFYRRYRHGRFYHQLGLGLDTKDSGARLINAGDMDAVLNVLALVNALILTLPMNILTGLDGDSWNTFKGTVSQCNPTDAWNYRLAGTTPGYYLTPQDHYEGEYKRFCLIIMSIIYVPITMLILILLYFLVRPAQAKRDAERKKCPR